MDDNLYFRCVKCNLGYPEERISLDTFRIAEYQINCDYCDTSMVLTGVSYPEPIIREVGSVQVRLSEYGYNVTLVNKEGLTQTVLRITDRTHVTRYFYERSEEITDSIRFDIGNAYKWIDTFGDRIGFSSVTEQG